MWSTFWGDVSEQGYYERAVDYEGISKRQIVGIFNVPYIYGMVLIRSSKLPAVLESIARTTNIITHTGVQLSGIDDWAMLFAYSLRERVSSYSFSNNFQTSNLPIGLIFRKIFLPLRRNCRCP